jgi:hypothetical protein
MTMVITLSFVGLEGQPSSSLEDDGIGHVHLLNSPLRKRRKVAMVIFPFSLEIGSADLLFFGRYAMTTSTTLY